MRRRADPGGLLKASPAQSIMSGVAAIESFLHFDIIHANYNLPTTSLKLPAACHRLPFSRTCGFVEFLF